jgi:alpha-L-fucosidase 2
MQKILNIPISSYLISDDSWSKYYFYAAVISIVFLLFSSNSISQQKSLRLWYGSPASCWEESLPLGNGRLGAMPDGGLLRENIVLNDITLWSGSAQDADKSDAGQYLPQIQKLLFEGKNIEAQEIMSEHFVCQGLGSGHGNGAKTPYGCYQILANLHLQYNYGIDSSKIFVDKYYRELSLDNAVAKTKFSVNNTSYEREYFTSFDDDVIIIKLSSGKLKKINFTLSMDRPELFAVKTENNKMQMSGQLNNGIDGKGMKYSVKLAVLADGGDIVTGEKTLQIKNANSAIIIISAGADYKLPNYLSAIDDNLARASKKLYKEELKNHIAKYQQLFHRTSLNLGTDLNYNIPTNERLAAFAASKLDNGLAVLYFQYGRYLLIGSTRAGLLPPNLQGLWANTIQTPWNGDYHLDINIQMNHWLLDVANLGMLNEPFFNLVKGLVEPGEKTAKAYYNAKGWVAHAISNIWGFTSPGESYAWGAYNTGSAWLCQMIWNHYEFSKDTAYLKMLYPVIKGSAEFYLSTLVKEPSHGWLVTAPSNSPENSFLLPNGKKATVCYGPAIDNQIIRFLFTAVIESGKELNIDKEFCDTLKKIIPQLPPILIGSDGRLMEWLKEYKEVEPYHRHVSHLWSLYPGNEITMTKPDLIKAARASLEARGDEGTGWSLAWKINFWARLHDGDRAYTLLYRLLKPVSGNDFNYSNGGGTYNNLFCAHPPFQIDGNFGGTAGIAEMLIQSHDGCIELLPALPNEWKNGSFSGLCARGGAEVSAKWKGEKVTTFSLKASSNGLFKIKIPRYAKNLYVKKNGAIIPNDITSHFLSVDLKKDESVEVVVK